MQGECRPGFVARLGTPNDLICVSEQERDQAKEDYLALQHRLAVWQFFNGIDNVFLTSNNNAPVLLL